MIELNDDNASYHFVVWMILVFGPLVIIPFVNPIIIPIWMVYGTVMTIIVFPIVYGLNHLKFWKRVNDQSEVER